MNKIHALFATFSISLIFSTILFAKTDLDHFYCESVDDKDSESRYIVHVYQSDSSELGYIMEVDDLSGHAADNSFDCERIDFLAPDHDAAVNYNCIDSNITSTTNLALDPEFESAQLFFDETEEAVNMICFNGNPEDFDARFPRSIN